MKELEIHYFNEGQLLVLKKSKLTFFLYGIVMIIAAVIFIILLENQEGGFYKKWPFYLAIAGILFFAVRYFKTTILGYQITFDKSNSSILFHDDSLIHFNDVSSVLVTYRDNGDTTDCYLELVQKKGGRFRIIKSDASLNKNIESTAKEIGNFINVSVEIKGKPWMI